MKHEGRGFRKTGEHGDAHHDMVIKCRDDEFGAVERDVANKITNEQVDFQR